MTSCIISSFYIKPQLCANSKSRALCCIISSFYIKPQLSPPLTAITTELYYIFILHQTTTMLKLQAEAISCIISSFYIKPQQPYAILYSHGVVLYLHSTSNHNSIMTSSLLIQLYYIFILHQTTTDKGFLQHQSLLYYIFILHQTTTKSSS